MEVILTMVLPKLQPLRIKSFPCHRCMSCNSVVSLRHHRLAPLDFEVVKGNAAALPLNQPTSYCLVSMSL